MKFNTSSAGSAAKLTLIIVIALVGAQCSFFQSQKNRSYRLTNKSFETERSLTFNQKEEDLLSISMFNTDGKPDQLWQITAEGDDYYRISNRSLGDRSFEVFDGKLDNRTRMAPTAKDDGQLWEIIPVRQDYYRISNKWLGSGKSLMTKKEEYYAFSLEASNNNDASLWKRISMGNDTYRLVNKMYGDQVTLYPTENGKLVMEPAKDATHTYQHWKMTPVGGNYFRIINVFDVHDKLDRSLDFTTTAQNIPAVKMNATGGGDSQKWKMEPAGGDYFRLTNFNGMSLQARFVSEFDLIMADSDDNNPDQLWKIVRNK